MSLLVVVAHQGGWDEILLVGGPIVVIVGVLAIVKRRVDAQLLIDDSDREHDVDHGHDFGHHEDDV